MAVRPASRIRAACRHAVDYRVAAPAASGPTIDKAGIAKGEWHARRSRKEDEPGQRISLVDTGRFLAICPASALRFATSVRMSNSCP